MDKQTKERDSLALFPKSQTLPHSVTSSTLQRWVINNGHAAVTFASHWYHYSCYLLQSSHVTRRNYSHSQALLWRLEPRAKKNQKNNNTVTQTGLLTLNWRCPKNKWCGKRKNQNKTKQQQKRIFDWGARAQNPVTGEGQKLIKALSSGHHWLRQFSLWNKCKIKYNETIIVGDGRPRCCHLVTFLTVSSENLGVRFSGATQDFAAYVTAEKN